MVEYTNKYAYLFEMQWGEILSITGPMADTLGQLNPFRYKGYYYDNETGFYYLQSRYYDPVMKRFISADSFANTGQSFTGSNMFAYCGNNPIMNHDSSGYSPSFISGILNKLNKKPVSKSKQHASEAKRATTTGVTPATPAYVAIPAYTENPLSVSGADGSGSQANCYTMAIGVGAPGHNPGFYSKTVPAPYPAGDVNAVWKLAQNDFNTLGIGYRVVKGPNSPIYENERRIALRVGPSDYHWLYQVDTGQWAGKGGFTGSTVLYPVGENPNTISWDLRIDETTYTEGYYDSDIIYIAIEG